MPRTEFETAPCLGGEVRYTRYSTEHFSNLKSKHSTMNPEDKQVPRNDQSHHWLPKHKELQEGLGSQLCEHSGQRQTQTTEASQEQCRSVPGFHPEGQYSLLTRS